MTSFPEKINALKGDMPARSFAKKCGIANSTMKGYLEGKNSPGLVNLKKIADAYGLQIGELTGDNLPWPAPSQTATATEHSSAAVAQNGNAVAINNPRLVDEQIPQGLTRDGLSTSILAQLLQDAPLLEKCMEQLQTLKKLNS